MRNAIGTITLFFVLILSVSAFAANKVVVIPLNSSSPVYVAGTEITSLPYTIASSGFYFITRDLTCTATDSHGITITADNVTLDLMGFSLIGPGVTGAYHVGIHMNGDSSNVEIRNGTVTNFDNAGIQVGSASGGKSHRIIDIRAVDNVGNGIFLFSVNNTVKGCTVSGNGEYGIYLSYGSTVTGNTAYNNGNDGIYADGGSTVTGNTAYSNTGDGIYAGHGSTVIGNTSRSNGAYGINLAINNLVDQNTATQNTTANMSICSPCTFGTNHAP